MRGAEGPMGLTGPSGPEGEIGPEGTKGEQGEIGEPVSIKTNTIKLLKAAVILIVIDFEQKCF